MISLAVLALNGAVTCTGGMRCGRTKFGIRNCTAAKITSVMAIAGSVLRMRTPAVTPSAKANAA